LEPDSHVPNLALNVVVFLDIGKILCVNMIRGNANSIASSIDRTECAAVQNRIADSQRVSPPPKRHGRILNERAELREISGSFCSVDLPSAFRFHD
jgi:hypothetical protein